MKVPNVLKETLGWALVLALLCVLAYLITGCAGTKATDPVTQEEVVPYWCWLPAFGWFTVWRVPATLSGAGDPGMLSMFGGLLSTWWPALTPALAAFPKVRDAVRAAVAADTPLLERPVALVSPALPLVHSPPSVKKQEAARKVRVAQKRANPDRSDP